MDSTICGLEPLAGLADMARLTRVPLHVFDFAAKRDGIEPTSTVGGGVRLYSRTGQIAVLRAVARSLADARWNRWTERAAVARLIEAVNADRVAWHRWLAMHSIREGVVEDVLAANAPEIEAKIAAKAEALEVRLARYYDLEGPAR